MTKGTILMQNLKPFVRHVWLTLLGLCLAFLFASPSQAQSSNCATSTAPTNYTVTVCITAPADHSTVSGVTTVTATFSTTGSAPGVQKMLFNLNNTYLLTDFTTPYTFQLPSAHFV